MIITYFWCCIVKNSIPKANYCKVIQSCSQAKLDFYLIQVREVWSTGSAKLITSCSNENESWHQTSSFVWQLGLAIKRQLQQNYFKCTAQCVDRILKNSAFMVFLTVDIVKVDALARQKISKRHFLEIFKIPSMRLLI